jgi:hypothetical protein
MVKLEEHFGSVLFGKTAASCALHLTVVQNIPFAQLDLGGNSVGVLVRWLKCRANEVVEYGDSLSQDEGDRSESESAAAVR